MANTNAADAARAVVALAVAWGLAALVPLIATNAADADAWSDAIEVGFATYGKTIAIARAVVKKGWR